MRERWPSPTYCAGGLPFRAGLLCTQHSGRAGLCSSVTSLDLNSNNIGGRGAAERTPAHAGIARPVVRLTTRHAVRTTAAVCSRWPSLGTTGQHGQIGASPGADVALAERDGMGWDGSVWG